MKHITIFLCFLLILLLQIDQQQAIPTHLSSTDELQDYPPSWYNSMDDIEDEKPQRSFVQVWKRIINDLSMVQRERRFGNTRYGRSLPSE